MIHPAEDLHIQHLAAIAEAADDSVLSNRPNNVLSNSATALAVLALQACSGIRAMP